MEVPFYGRVHCGPGSKDLLRPQGLQEVCRCLILHAWLAYERGPYRHNKIVAPMDSYAVIPRVQECVIDERRPRY